MHKNNKLINKINDKKDAKLKKNPLSFSYFSFEANKKDTTITAISGINLNKKNKFFHNL